VFRLFRRSQNKPLIDRLNGEIMAAARQPTFFTEYGVADTVEGRFELLCVLATTTMRRIEKLPAPGPQIAQELTDAVFAGFDIALREIGVGDLTVPKKMKKMAQGWLGRGVAYRAALDAGDVAGMALAVARNVYGDEQLAGQERVMRLARYAFAQDKVMEGLDVEGVLGGPLPFIDPAGVPG
jgi:cytochrome b pre-mRNA-processing protein 3